MSCYPTDSTQWSLWVLHEKVRESNYKAQGAYVSILFHVKISPCWVNGQSFHTKPNTAGTRLHRSSACHTYVISSDLVDKVIINGLNKLCQMLTKGVTGSCSRGRAFTKNVQCRDMIPQHHRDANKKALSWRKWFSGSLLMSTSHYRNTDARISQSDGMIRRK